MGSKDSRPPSSRPSEIKLLDVLYGEWGVLLSIIDIIFINYHPSTIMPSLITKWKKGRPYLYWVRSAWRNGHSRIVEQHYLGPRDRVIEQIRAQCAASPPTEALPPLHTVQTREFGASALFYSLAQELGL